MTAFLFWNIHGKDLRSLVTGLAGRHDVDVLMLAESGIEPGILLDALNRIDGGGYEYFPGIGCERIQVFARFPAGSLTPVEESDQVTIRHLRPPEGTDIILTVVHLRSKLHRNHPANQTPGCSRLSRTIRAVEERLNHCRTVLVGDLNLDPFEVGVISADGLHGVMSRRIARRGGRTVEREHYPFFYNPMWSLLGDVSPGARLEPTTTRKGTT